MSEEDDVELEVCGGVELLELPLFGDVLLGVELVEEPLFGEVLLGEVLLEEPVAPVVELLLDVLLPALPEMLPAVLPLWSLLEELGLVEEADPDIPEEEPAPLALALATSTLSFTFFTPATDFAIFLAAFLSSLLATVPDNFTVPLSTST
jgi:hypothetical protein